MSKKLCRDNLLEQTVVAVRNGTGRDGTDQGWQVLDLRCNSRGIQHELANRDIADAEWRWLGYGKVHPAYAEQFMIGRAVKSGWHLDTASHKWFPLEEPLPLLEGDLDEADVVISLVSIVYGWITVKIVIGDRPFELVLSDVDDSLAMWVRFVQLLEAGGAPHAALADHATTEFIVQHGASPKQCRFVIRSSNYVREEFVQVVTDRDRLVLQFRNLLASIADHPFFAHHYWCHCCLPDDDYERVASAAKDEWALQVAAGLVEDDLDAKDRHEAARIAANVQIPKECAQEAEEWRAALKSLKLPGSTVATQPGLSPLSMKAHRY